MNLFCVRTPSATATLAIVLLLIASSVFAAPAVESTSQTDGESVGSTPKTVLLAQLDSCASGKKWQEFLEDTQDLQSLANLLDPADLATMEALQNSTEAQSSAMQELRNLYSLRECILQTVLAFEPISIPGGLISVSVGTADGAISANSDSPLVLYYVLLVYDTIALPYVGAREEDYTKCLTFERISLMSRSATRACSVSSRPPVPISDVFLSSNSTPREKKAICKQMADDMLRICARDIKVELQQARLTFKLRGYEEVTISLIMEKQWVRKLDVSYASSGYELTYSEER